MVKMKKIASVMGLCAAMCTCSVAFAAVDPNDPAASWSGISASERLNYTRRASVACQSTNCGEMQIKACMDTVVRPPIPAGVKGMTIGELAVNCIAMLKAQR